MILVKIVYFAIWKGLEMLCTIDWGKVLEILLDLSIISLKLSINEKVSLLR
jgi:hypothetical protein